MNELKQILLDNLLLINVLQDMDEPLPGTINLVWLKNLILELDELKKHLEK